MIYVLPDGLVDFIKTEPKVNSSTGTSSEMGTMICGTRISFDRSSAIFGDSEEPAGQKKIKIHQTKFKFRQPKSARGRQKMATSARNAPFFLIFVRKSPSFLSRQFQSPVWPASRGSLENAPRNCRERKISKSSFFSQFMSRPVCLGRKPWVFEPAS
jgi:hypothetical protein